MEFLKVVKRRSVLSESIYVLLNLALALAVLAVVLATGTPWLGMALVLLSKWRVLAVRPRYWFTHIESNMVDIIVSVGIVVLIYLAGQMTAGQGLLLQCLLTAAYAAWLLLLKPRGTRRAVAIQAGAAITIGTVALVSVSYEWPSSLVVLGMWLIGYTSARHVLLSYSDENLRLLSMIWGFVAAELGWLTYHMTLAYPPLGIGLKLPQVTLLLLGLSFVAERAYSSYDKHGSIKRNDILLPLLLVVGIFVVILLIPPYNQPPIGGV